MDVPLQEIYDSIINGANSNTSEKVAYALEIGYQPETILNDSMVLAMGEVGRLFEEGEYFVPEMLVSARAMQAGLAILKPRLVEPNKQLMGKVAIGTVIGDYHDIGKNLVAMMLEGAAFEIIDLGANVSPERFVQAVTENGAQIVAMSALLTTTMGKMREIMEALNAAGVRQQVKVMVGGAPVTQKFAEEIGADGYAPDASRAVSKAKELVRKA